MSSKRQAVVFEPNFTGFGNRPAATPAHQDDAEIGNIGSIGGDEFLLPMICLRRKNFAVFWVGRMPGSMVFVGHDPL